MALKHINTVWRGGHLRLHHGVPGQVHRQDEVRVVEEAGRDEDGTAWELDISTIGNCSQLGVPRTSLNRVEESDLSFTDWKGNRVL